VIDYSNSNSIMTSRSIIKTYLTFTSLICLLSIKWSFAASGSVDQVRNCDYRTSSRVGKEDDGDEDMVSFRI